MKKSNLSARLLPGGHIHLTSSVADSPHSCHDTLHLGRLLRERKGLVIGRVRAHYQSLPIVGQTLPDFLCDIWHKGMQESQSPRSFLWFWRQRLFWMRRALFGNVWRMFPLPELLRKSGVVPGGGGQRRIADISSRAGGGRLCWNTSGLKGAVTFECGFYGYNKNSGRGSRVSPREGIAPYEIVIQIALIGCKIVVVPTLFAHIENALIGSVEEDAVIPPRMECCSGLLYEWNCSSYWFLLIIWQGRREYTGVFPPAVSKKPLIPIFPPFAYKIPAQNKNVCFIIPRIPFFCNIFCDSSADSVATPIENLVFSVI